MLSWKPSKRGTLLTASENFRVGGLEDTLHEIWFGSCKGSFCQLTWTMGFPGVWSYIILFMVLRCVWMRLTLKLVERVNQIDLPNMGFIPWASSNQQKRNKGWPSSQWERIPSAWLFSHWGIGFLLPLDSKCYISSSRVLILLSFGMEQQDQLCCSFSLLAPTANPGTCQLPSLCGPIPYNESLALCLNLYHLLSPSLSLSLSSWSLCLSVISISLSPIICHFSMSAVGSVSLVNPDTETLNVNLAKKKIITS